ncbi:3'-5' exonuclease [Rudanella paleaurantiibacter]|uniref:3'-5' exonuclease n=1 Tax=Rudanella paleaurantiibacter TaxID=2614655 RepID=A0A7J5TSC3_9BACT|nr:3'-5' exonuclease [Rudanella paleaurantiibacter]KAB7725851.1 3'-5' exonuclease [Rudanella paleaurantiibacter]
MTYLIIDTETNGLPQSYHLPATDLTNWPRLISVAWGLYDEQGKELCRQYALVKPDGYRWNKVAQQVHRITPEEAETKGQPLVDVLNQLRPALERADVWVGHNIDLDYGVIGAEFIRVNEAKPGRVGEFPARPVICTMDASVKVTPNREPVKLEELYKLLTGKRMMGMHDATADMLATARCFFELKRRSIFA